MSLLKADACPVRLGDCCINSVHDETLVPRCLLPPLLVTQVPLSHLKQCMMGRPSDVLAQKREGQKLYGRKYFFWGHCNIEMFVQHCPKNGNIFHIFQCVICSAGLWDNEENMFCCCALRSKRLIFLMQQKSRLRCSNSVDKVQSDYQRTERAGACLCLCGAVISADAQRGGLGRNVYARSSPRDPVSLQPRPPGTAALLFDIPGGLAQRCDNFILLTVHAATKWLWVPPLVFKRKWSNPLMEGYQDNDCFCLHINHTTRQRQVQ